MPPRPVEDMQAALATTECVLASLRRELDALQQIVQAVEDQQAELLVSLLNARARRYDSV
jgi:hypothetical protein